MGLGTICVFPGRRLNSFLQLFFRGYVITCKRLQESWISGGFFCTLVISLKALLLDFQKKKNWPESINHQIFLPQNPLAEERQCRSLSVLWINFSLNLLWLPWTLISQGSRSQVLLGLRGHQQYLAFDSKASPGSHLLKQTLLEGAL